MCRHACQNVSQCVVRPRRLRFDTKRCPHQISIQEAVPWDTPGTNDAYLVQAASQYRETTTTGLFRVLTAFALAIGLAIAWPGSRGVHHRSADPFFRAAGAKVYKMDHSVQHWAKTACAQYPSGEPKYWLSYGRGPHRV